MPLSLRRHGRSNLLVSSSRRCSGDLSGTDSVLVSLSTAETLSRSCLSWVPDSGAVSSVVSDISTELAVAALLSPVPGSEAASCVFESLAGAGVLVTTPWPFAACAYEKEDAAAILAVGDNACVRARTALGKSSGCRVRFDLTLDKPVRTAGCWIPPAHNWYNVRKYAVVCCGERKPRGSYFSEAESLEGQRTSAVPAAERFPQEL